MEDVFERLTAAQKVKGDTINRTPFIPGLTAAQAVEWLCETSVQDPLPATHSFIWGEVSWEGGVEGFSARPRRSPRPPG